MSNTKLWALSITLIVFAAVVFFLSPVLANFIAAGVIAYLLSPITELLEKRFKMKHWCSVFIVFTGVILIMALILVIIVPLIAAQISTLITDLPEYTDKLYALAETLRVRAAEIGIPESMINTVDSMLSESDGLIAQTVVNFGKNVLASSFKIIDVLLIAVLILYFLLDGKKIIAGFIAFFPKRIQYRVKNVLEKADTLVWKFLKAQVIISLFVFIVTWVGLEVLQVKFALLLSVITFFFNFIPMFGSFFAGLIAVAVAFFTSGWLSAVIVCIFILIVQQVEGNIVAPKIQSHNSGMHPVTIIFSLLACNHLFGAGGMFFAVPIAGFAKLVFIEVRDILREMS